MAAFAMVDWQASAATTKKPARKTAAVKSSGSHTAGAKASSRKTPVKAASARTATAKRGKKSVLPKVTWRNRQMAPAPERYREIQEALVAKGYLAAGEGDGSWNAASSEALKRFQADQNLDPTGKINSLSLIALGLGPKRDSVAVKPPDAERVER